MESVGRVSRRSENGRLFREALRSPDPDAVILHLASLVEKDGANYDFKIGCGGLMDIRFVVKYLQLQHGIEGRRTRFGISGLVEAGHLDPDEGRVLVRGAGFLFHLEALQRLLAESPVTRLPRDPSRCAVTARLMGLDPGDALLDHYRIETSAIRQIDRHIFYC